MHHLLLLTALAVPNLAPFVDYLIHSNSYPEAVLLAEAVLGRSPSAVVLSEVWKASDPLIAALALKLFGYNVPPNLLDVRPVTVCGKAEKAYALGVLGYEAWRGLAEDVLRTSVLKALNQGLACACKAAFFMKLLGYDVPWGQVLLQLRPDEVKSVEALIWCSAYQLLYGHDALYTKLLNYLSPEGYVTNEIGLPDDYLTAQFLEAYSLLKLGKLTNVTRTNAPSPHGEIKVTYVTLTKTVTQTQEVTRTVYVTETRYATRTVTTTVTSYTTANAYVTETVTATVTLTRFSSCIPANEALLLTTYSTTTTTITVPVKSFVLLEVPVNRGSEVYVSCVGGCQRIYVGEGYTVYTVYRGGPSYVPDGGSFKYGPCGGGLVWSVTEGPLRIMPVGQCTATIYLTETATTSLLCPPK